ncbi:MAG: RbsD/FucU family protein [Eubacteriales bacterium]
MLKHIPKTLTPELFKVLTEAGHGEEILLCDANFPYKSKKIETIILPVVSITELLKDILYYFPLDTSVDYPAAVMEKAMTNGVAESYYKVFSMTGNDNIKIQPLERFAFYDRTKNATAIVVTADSIPAGNILLIKGVVKE